MGIGKTIKKKTKAQRKQTEERRLKN